VLVVGAYAFGVSYGLGKGIDRLLGFRASAEEELTGLDLTVHAETAYDNGMVMLKSGSGDAQVRSGARAFD
jgi:Amt family ammonium transporter